MPSKHRVRGSNPFGQATFASVVELVDTRDLKSLAKMASRFESGRSHQILPMHERGEGGHNTRMRYGKNQEGREPE